MQLLTRILNRHYFLFFNHNQFIHFMNVIIGKLLHFGFTIFRKVFWQTILLHFFYLSKCKNYKKLIIEILIFLVTCYSIDMFIQSIKYYLVKLRISAYQHGHFIWSKNLNSYWTYFIFIIVALLHDLHIIWSKTYSQILLESVALKHFEAKIVYNFTCLIRKH